jgi:hypothetical protein
VISTTETSYIYSTNPVVLKATITVDNGGYPGQDVGEVTFYRADTDEDIGVVSVSSGTAVLNVTAEQIPGASTGTSTIIIGARFNGTLAADSVTTNNITATVVNSSFDMVPFQFSRYMMNELGQTVPQYDYTLPIVSYIPPTIIKTITRSDYPELQIPNRKVSLSSSTFTIDLPMTSFRGICAYEDQDVYGQAFNRSGYWDRSSSFYFVFKYTIVGGVYNGQSGWFNPRGFMDENFNICSVTKFDGSPDAGPSRTPYYFNVGSFGRNGRSTTVGGIYVYGYGVNSLDWLEPWDRIDIEMSVVGTSIYTRGIASVPPGINLGISGTWNIS